MVGNLSQALNGTVFHSMQWKRVLIDTYGYDDKSYVGKGGRTYGPIMLINNRLLRKRVLSALPFSDEAGPIYDTAEAPNVDDYFRHLVSTQERVEADYIEIKGLKEDLVSRSREFGFVELYENFTFRIDLLESSDRIFQGFSKNVRRNIAKLGDLDLAVNGSGYLDEFYSLHQITMKRLGTPPHKRSCFEMISEMLGEQALYLHALDGQCLLATILILLDHNDHCARYIAGASDQRGMQVNANTFLFHKGIQLCRERGFRFFDFGVTRPGTGVWEFKRKWTQSSPIPVRYVVRGRSEDYVDPRNRGIERVSRFWRRYLPGPIANVIGPSIRGQLGK